MQISIEELYRLFLTHRSISTDSRQIIPGCLFFALKGDNFDGNKYATAALDAGASFAIIDDPQYDNAQVLLVNDVLETLQQLALMHRRKFAIPVLAITGSNGKTTTKELVNAVLSEQYRVTATKGNLNNHIGVPVTLLGITENTQIAIIEMGANHQGEIAQLCRIAEPTHGLITNIGRAHLGGFGGFEGVIKAKSELYGWLFKSDGIAFVNTDNHLLVTLSEGISSKSYGSDHSAFCSGFPVENTEMLEIKWVQNTQTVDIKTNLVGGYNFENVLAAICVGSYFQVSGEKIKSAINLYQPSNSRSQYLKTANNSVILDAYNANPTSMQAAINNFIQLKASHKMVILGDMLELGPESASEHLAIVNLVQKAAFDIAVLVGPEFKAAGNEKFHRFDNSGDAYQWLKDQHIRDFTILVKGSRGIKMEKVLDAL